MYIGSDRIKYGPASLWYIILLQKLFLKQKEFVW